MTDKEPPAQDAPCEECKGEYDGAGHCPECKMFTKNPKYAQGEPDVRTMWKSKTEIQLGTSGDLLTIEVRSKNKEAVDHAARQLVNFIKNTSFTPPPDGE